MGTRIGEEVALTLEAQSERRCDNRVAYDGHMVQRVVEAERKTYDEQRSADCDLGKRCVQVRGRESAVRGRLGQRGALDLDHGDIDLPARVDPLSPDGFAVAVQRNREPSGARHVVRVDVELDLDTIGEVLARLVDQNVTARHQEQPCIALEEKSARVRQHSLLFEGEDTRCGQQKRFDHRCRWIANASRCF